ncbi:MAG: glycosyltransferase [Acidipropionibacterium acidipropionici]|uniref:glycosyltransferase family 2 protein n=1 Tax=Acidipropionibacterium acidipropionici TaxID=1748 RepID=UPI002F35FD9B
MDDVYHLSPEPQAAGSARGPGAPRVLVAVTTFRRTHLLPGLIARIQQESAAAPCQARLLVVDNDPGRSARRIAEETGAGYLPVAQPGIAAARQAALAAGHRDELTVMVDDDVVPQAGWLSDLVAVWQETRATVVMGFVEYVWPPGCDPWVSDSGFMRRSRHARAQNLDYLATSNALFDTAGVRELGVDFDTTLGLEGGEDTRFGRDVLAAGGRIVAAPGSVVRADIPPERATREFARRRARTQGASRSRMLIEDPRDTVRLMRCGQHLIGGLVRLAVFSAGALIFPARLDRRRNAVFTRRAWFAQGRILGALGKGSPLYTREPSQG